MKIPKIPRRVIHYFFLTLLGVFVVYFVLLVWSYTIPDPDVEAFAVRIDDLIEYRMQPDPKDAPSVEIDETQLLILDNEAEQFRQAAVMVPDTKSLSELPQVMPGAFDEFFKGEISAKFPLLWPFVISGSSMIIGNALGDEPVVAYYNPYYDVVLLTQWTLDSSGAPGFKMKKAYPVTGLAFVENRASTAEDVQSWAGSQTRIFETALVKATQDFVAAFEERYPPPSRAVADLSGEAAAAEIALNRLEDRVFFFLQWLIDAQNPEAEVNYAVGIKQVRKALSAYTQGFLEALLPEDNPQGAEYFFHLEQAVREGMQPYMVVEQNVIFVNPLLVTNAFISVHFEPGEKGYKPGLVALFNTGTQEPVH